MKIGANVWKYLGHFHIYLTYILGDGSMKNVTKIEKNEKYGNVVSSRTIANELQKRHSDVLRDLKNLLKQTQQNQENGNLRSLIFENFYRVNNQNRTYKEYLLTKDGFTLYMFNIQGYIDFKMAYINQFNKMEKQIRQLKITNQNNIMIPINKVDYWNAIKLINKEIENTKLEAIDEMRKFNNIFYDLSANFNRIINLSEGISHTMQQIEK